MSKKYSEHLLYKNHKTFQHFQEPNIRAELKFVTKIQFFKNILIKTGF